MTLSVGAALFQVIVPGNQAAADPLGLWQTIPAGTSFAASEPQGMVWRAELPADPMAATQALQAQAFYQRRLRQALVTAPQTLRENLNDLRAGGPAFGTEMAGTGGPLGVLQLALQHAGDESADAVLEELGARAAVEVFQQFIAQVERMVGQLALVESAAAGRRLGVTRVGWTGRVDTWWGAGTSAVDIAQHNQLLAAALASRQNWLHYFSVVTSAVLRISVVLGLGPFSPLAIWTAWSYLQEVLSFIRSQK